MKKKTKRKPLPAYEKHARELNSLLKHHKLSDLLFNEETGRYIVKTDKQKKMRYVKASGGRKVTDLGVYQVFRDANGIAYLRTAYTQRGAMFVVNKAFTVELLEIDAHSTHGQNLALCAVPNASIVECAKRLLHPLNDQCTISQRAKEQLTKILQSKELQMKATAPGASPTKPAKFANVTAPPAKKGKATNATPAKAAAKPAKKTVSGNGEARTTIAGKKIKVLNRKHEAREGTKRAQGLDIILASKTTDEALPKLIKIGADASFISFAVKSGLVSLS